MQCQVGLEGHKGFGLGQNSAMPTPLKAVGTGEQSMCFSNQMNSGEMYSLCQAEPGQMLGDMES